MSLNSLNKYLTNNALWIFISIITLIFYLSPLFHNVFYVPTFDNLDSNVVWYKILAESGKIFADNNAIIPNMMSGLPRSSYGSEFNVILWLYYFFEPKTAFIINEVTIHLVAFFSMYIFLNKYIVKQNTYYGNVPIFVGALYFALLPFWSGAGLSIAILPLVTYSLLNIKNNISTKWDWLLIIVLPLYTSFIFLYMFYIIMAGIYLMWDTIKNHKLNKPFFFALFLMGTVFLLSEYRLVYNMFIDSNFVSHRTEFDIFFREDLWESYRLTLVNFLLGHKPHAETLQDMYLLPIVLTALMLSSFNRRLTVKESIVVWIMILLSFLVNIWEIVLINKYTLPGIILLSLFVYFKQKRYRKLPLFLLLVILLSVFASAFEYQGLKWITNIFPIFNALNMIRMLFVEPFIYVILLTFSIIIIFRKLHFSSIFTVLFICFQFYHSYIQSFYQSHPKAKYSSFSDYYAPKLFQKLKQDISKEGLKQVQFVSYGIEPAVILFNGLYTTDGYSANYPLSYKYQFKKIFSPYQSNDLFNRWGSKVYIPTIPNHPLDIYLTIKGLKIQGLQFDLNSLCELNTTHLISPYLFEYPEQKNLQFLNRYKGSDTSWDIYLYKLHCMH